MLEVKKDCLVCGGIFTITRNPHQKYCSKLKCQNSRKNSWRKAKLKTDVDYQTNQSKANERWRETHPAYWKNYRANHPEYVRKNREQQRRRDRAVLCDERCDASSLAKSDTLSVENSFRSGTYILTLLDPLLAKSDALKVKIDVISTGY
jgi:hypothetical protein